MNFPKPKDEIIKSGIQYRGFIASEGIINLPQEFEEIEESSSIKLLFVLLVTLFHGMLFYIAKLSMKFEFWMLVTGCALLRISTDKWSLTPRECGYNRAYTLIGLARLKHKDIHGAIEALQKSWQVLLCPHSSSFGLLTSLAKQLKEYPEAENSINDYREIYNAFRI
jgi:hypothetical protein